MRALTLGVASMVFVGTIPLANGTAHAQQVSLVALCDDSPELQQTRALAKDQLVDKGWEVRLIPDAGKFIKPCAAPNLDGIKQSLEDAKEQFYALKLRAARRALKDLRERLNALELQTPPDVLREVYVFSAWAEMELRNAGGAKTHYRSVLRLWPQWRPDPLSFAPEIVQAFDRVAQTAKKDPKGTVAASTDPEGADVTVDGDRSCTSPCSISDLLPGEHFVHVQHPGHASTHRRVNVQAKGTTNVEFTLPEDHRDQLATAITNEDSASARDLLDKMAVTGSVVILEPYREGGKSGESIHSIWVAPDGISTEEHGSPETAAQDVVGWVLEGPAKLVATPPPAVTTIDDSGGSLVTRWWFWTAVGVVAAGAGVGVWALTRPDDVAVVVRP